MTINVRYWITLVAGQRQQYQGASVKGRAELREIWEGQRVSNLHAADRMARDAWPSAQVEATRHKASYWAELLQWADDIESQRPQFGLALEVA